MSYVIGLDAGGSKTQVVVLDDTRHELGRGSGGPSNYHSAGKENTLSAIQQALDEALQHAQLTRAHIAQACFAMSGVDRPADQLVAESFAQMALPNVPTVICNDAIAALYSGAGQAEGIVVIAGTGSIVYGFAPDGRKTRAGGWGYHLGDEGSGWWLAEQSLFAITRAHDGRGPMTTMLTRYLNRLKLAKPEDLIGWAYSPTWTRDNVSSLAPLTFDAAQAGDAIALQIVNQGATTLAQAVQVVSHKLAMHTTPFTVVMFGSLFRSTLYEYALRRALSEQTAHAQPVLPTVDAAVGAAWVALDALHGKGRTWIE
jgi:N-acetylglucosamine kinase-like BadF-type ATPase